MTPIDPPTPTDAPPSSAIVGPTAPTPAHADRSARLWRMSPAERTAAMWAGQLTHGQLLEWTRRAPREVPRIGGEFAWIKLRDPDCLDGDPPTTAPGRAEERSRRSAPRP